jgi:hypothetical protein
MYFLKKKETIRQSYKIALANEIESNNKAAIING